MPIIGPPSNSSLHAKVVQIELQRELAPLPVEDRYDEVLLVVRLAGAVIGHVMTPARGVLTPAEQRTAVIDVLGRDLVRQRLHSAVMRAGRPERDEPQDVPVTVLVCTRRRADQLDACLSALERLRPRAERVIVIDNSPGDPGTARVAAAHDVECVVEPHPGQSRARNRGLSLTMTPYAAFTDDDCIVDPSWLADIGRDFEDPLVAAVTGYVGPVELEHPAQYLFEAHGGFTRHSEPRVFEGVQWSPLLAASIAGAGANLIVRVDALDEVGGFAEDLGPGTPARSGDDKEFVYRIFRRGLRVAYAPGRVVLHRHRASDDALARILNDYGTAEFAYTSRAFALDHDLNAFRLWRWWAGHFAKDVLRHARKERGAVGLPLVWEEVRGAITGPLAMVHSRRSRRELPEVEPRPATRPPAGAPVRVVRDELAISVAVASYDGARDLPAVIEGLAHQDLPATRFEVVVVLDGSRDGSAELLENTTTPYPLRHVWQENGGLASARQRGADEARHDVVVFLDDDIVPSRELLAAHAAVHARSAGRVALGYCPPIIADRDDPWGQVMRSWWEDHYRRKAQPNHRWAFTDVTDGNLSLSVQALRAVGGFDASFRHRRQDWDLGIRLLAAGTQPEYVRSAVGRHHLETDYARALANAQGEGRDDVALGRKHPQVRGQLPLAELATRQFGPGPLKWHAMATVAERGPAAVRRLPGVGLRGAWAKLSFARLGAAYRAGVREALSEARARREYLAPVARGDHLVRVPWELDDDRPPELPSDGRPALLDVSLSGTPVVTVRAIPPGSQWDWYRMAQSIARGAPVSSSLAEHVMTTACAAA